MESVDEFDAAVRAALTGEAGPHPLSPAAASLIDLNDQAHALADLAQRTSDTGLFELYRRILELHRTKLGLVPARSQFRAGALSDVTRAGSNVLFFARDPAILAEMLSAAREGVQLCDSRQVNPSIEVQLRTALCQALVKSTPGTHSPAQIEEAIAAAQAATVLPMDNGDAINLALLLAESHLIRHDLMGDENDLKRAFGLANEVIENARTADQAAPAHLICGNVFLATDRLPWNAGAPADAGARTQCLDAAIDAFTNAVARCRPGTGNAAAAAASLRHARIQRLVRRYRLDEPPAASVRMVASEDLVDLDAVIDELHREVSRLERENLTDELVHTLNTLSGALRNQAFLHSSQEPLREAVEALARSASLSAVDGIARAMVLTNMGTRLWEMWRNDSHDPEDLSRCHEALSEAGDIIARRFLPMPVLYQLDDQRDWAEMRSRVVTSALDLAQAQCGRAEHWQRRSLLTAESTKSRLLTALVGRTDLPAPAGVTAAEAETERQLLGEVRYLDAVELRNLDRPPPPPQDRADLARRRQQAVGGLEALWESFGRRGPNELAYAQFRSGRVIDWEALSSLVSSLNPRTVAVSLFAAHDRCVAWLMSADAGPIIAETPLDTAGVANILEAFRLEVDVVGKEFGSESWYTPLLSLLTPFRSALAGIDTALVVPHGPLHLLPWAVVFAHAGFRAPDGGPLTVVTTPALSVFTALRAIPASTRSGTLVVGDPLGDLSFAASEARAIAAEVGPDDMISGRLLIGAEAVRATVLERLEHCSIAHFATHATFDPANPLESGIQLADGVLTARDLLARRLDLDVLVLSGCDSGRTASRGGDELLGLSQACLQAGVRTLVVSLWPVLDTTTAQLMRAFHASRLAGHSIAKALAVAASEVRTTNGHTYHWGPFIALGTDSL